MPFHFQKIPVVQFRVERRFSSWGSALSPHARALLTADVFVSNCQLIQSSSIIISNPLENMKKGVSFSSVSQVRGRLVEKVFLANSSLLGIS